MCVCVCACLSTMGDRRSDDNESSLYKHLNLCLSRCLPVLNNIEILLLVLLLPDELDSDNNS